MEGERKRQSRTKVKPRKKARKECPKERKRRKMIKRLKETE